MAENKKSIIVYAEWLEQFEYLTDEEAGKLIKHFFRYVNDLKPIAPDRFTEAQFIPIKQTLKRDLDKWEKTIADRSYNGRVGNLKKYNLDLFDRVSNNEITLEAAEEIARHRKASQPDSIATKNVANVAVNVNDNVNVNDINKGKNFVFYSELSNSESWIERVSMTNTQKYNPKEVKEKLKIFFDDCDVRGDVKTNKTDFQSHFVRWLNQQIKPKEVTKKPPLL